MNPLYAPAPPRRVDLEFPIDVPGGMISSLLVRPLYAADEQLRSEGVEGEARALANAIFACPDVVAELDEVDHESVIEGLVGVCDDYRATGLFGPRFRLIIGGGP